MPVAENGVIDLSTWDAARDGPVRLDGQWQFFWGRLLGPGDFTPGAVDSSDFLHLPGTWKGHEYHDQPLPGRGQATFRLRLLPGTGDNQLALRLFAIHGAYRLWADGKLIASSGVIGNDDAGEIANRSLVLAKLESHAAPIELVLQISNYTLRRGGVLHPIVLGLPDQLERDHIRTWAWSMCFVGGMLIMAIYHFALFFLKKKEISTLYFGLECIIFSCIFVTFDSSDWLLAFMFPHIDPGTIARICIAAYAISGSFIYRFYRSMYPKEFIILFQHICDIRSVVFVFIVITQRQSVMYDSVPWLSVVTFALNIVYLVSLSLCLWRRRDGALVLSLGFIVLSATSIYDIAWHVFSHGGIDMLPLGVLAFVLSQALAMAQRFSNAFTAVEKLSTDLRVEMDERTRLEREIVNVSEEERRRLSHDLHDGLCQQLTGTRMRCAALARRPIAEPAVEMEVQEIAALLKDSVSQAYDLSRGLWPVEHAPGDVRASLAELARQAGRSSGIDIDYSENLACARCRNEHLVQLFRIAQEAVANAVKHAKPACIDIALHCGPDRRLVLTVRDDGIGRQAASVPQGGLGLRIMAYRASMIQAELTIDDVAGGGTLVSCSLVCAPDRTPREDGDG
ncbi:MAG: sensor histidine kinase [Desulfovibrio sp.]|nr:sensor histidine kinase [Desulfovibrio sp.]MBI4961005.1 sensor histidine kinase [Desulfovibrio sp.]